MLNEPMDNQKITCILLKASNSLVFIMTGKPGEKHAVNGLKAHLNPGVNSLKTYGSHA